MNTITKDKIMSIEERKNKIKSILKQINRDGINSLISYLEDNTDFYTAPCSTQYHLSSEGGLAEHSLNVYTLLKEKIKYFNLTKDVSDSSIAICGLLHDLCKTNFYEKGTKWVKINGGWQEQEIWVVNDQFPVGHGEKSVFLLQRYITLSNEEIAAIRWHMMAFDAGIHFNYPSGYSFRSATEKYPLVTLLATADIEASNIIERKVEKN